MELYAIEGNPIPDGATVGSVPTPDGLHLRYAIWPAATLPTRGTICLLQGRGEMIEKYFEVVGELRARGFAVAAFDWRGQGGSDRRLRNPRKAHVDSFSEYDVDLETFVQHVMLPDCPPPHYALAHSMGALVALRAARVRSVRFERLILSAPLIGWGQLRPRQPWAGRIAATMTALGLGELRAPGDAKATIARVPFEGNRLTGDAARFRRNRNIVQQLPRLAVDGPTLGWVHAASRAVKKANQPDFAPAIRIPTLAIIGALDKVVSVEAVERLAMEMRAGGQLVLRGALHELLWERDIVREQFFAALDAFLPGRDQPSR